LYRWRECKPANSKEHYCEDNISIVHKRGSVSMTWIFSLQRNSATRAALNLIATNDY
jgi:hypothetical protein